jgi:PAS domain S-box-containing protein
MKKWKDFFYSKQGLVFITILICAGLVIVGFLSYKHEQKIITDNQYQNLKAIAELKINQVELWKKEQLGNAQILSEDPYFSKTVDQFIRNDLQDTVSSAYIYDRFHSLQAQYSYIGFQLISLNNKVLLSLENTGQPVEPDVWSVVVQVIQTGQPAMTDLYQCGSCDQIRLGFIAPMYNPSHQMIAVINLIVDPNHYLFPVIQSIPTNSRSLETALIKRQGDDVLFLNTLRFNPAKPLTFTIPLTQTEVPAVQAILGKRGFTQGNDYRGIPVVSYLTKIQNTNWFIVSKMDEAELFSELNYRAMVIAICVILMVGLTILISSYIYSNRQKKLYQRLIQAETDQAKTQEYFRATLYSIGDAVITTDKNGNVQQMNAVAEKLTGYREEDAKNHPLQQIFEIENENTHLPVDNPVEKVLAEGVIVGLANHTVLHSHDGIEYPIADSGAPIHAKDGQTIGVVLVFRDMTDERLLQRQIIQQKEKYQLLFDNMDQGFSLTEIIQDESGKPIDIRYLDANQAFGQQTGLIPDQIIGKTAREVFFQDADFWIEESGKVALSGKATSYEIHSSAIDKDFSVRLFSPIHGQVATLFTDITDLVKNEKALRKSEASFRLKSEEQEFLYTLSTQLRESVTANGVYSILLNEINRIIPCDSVVIIMLNSNRNSFSIVRTNGLLQGILGSIYNISEGIAGQVLRTSETIILEDYTQHPNRLFLTPEVDEIGPAIFVPILAVNDLMGVLMLSRKKQDSPRYFTENENRLLTSICELVGSTLHRIKMNDMAAKHLKRTQVLHNIDLAISGSFDLQTVLKSILESARQELDVDAADIYLFNKTSLMMDFQVGTGFNHPDLITHNIRLRDSLVEQVIIQQQRNEIPDIKNASPHVTQFPLMKSEGFQAYFASPIISKGTSLGVLEVFNRKPIEIDNDWLDFMDTLAGQTSLAIDNLSLFDSLQDNNLRLLLAYDSTLETLANITDLHDGLAEGHSNRIVNLTIALARKMNVNSENIVHIRRGTILHDIGHMGISDAILKKPGQLSPEERQVVEQHPSLAKKLLSPIAYLRQAIEIPVSHHERWDGSGYPDRLVGKQIPLSARIFAVVDVWDALTSIRPYRAAWTDEQAWTYIREQNGKLFDPDVVKAFFDLKDELSRLFDKST